MPEYQYQARDIAGKPYSGILEADSLESFYRVIKERGQFCITVREAGTQGRELRLTDSRIRLKELGVFCRQFSTMLTAGMPAIRCLDILYQQAGHKKLKRVVLGVYEAVQRGDSLSIAMRAQKEAFPMLMISMVEAGEASGTLDSVMSRLADQYEKDNQNRNKLQQALTYPAFLACMMVVVVVFLLAFIMPRFMGLFVQYGVRLPLPTRILLGISHAITGYWYAMLMGVAALAVAWHFCLRNDAVRTAWDRFKLRMPVFGKLLLIIEASRFARTLAALFGSGMPIIQSMEIVARVVRNRYIQLSLGRAGEDVRRGVSISAAIRKLGLFPPMLCSMLSIGEESGDMDGILRKTAAFYDEESDAAIQRLISILEPAMIVLLAVVVGFIIVSFILPIFSMYSQINSVGAAG